MQIEDTGLYKISKNEIISASIVLSDSFIDDPMWKLIIPETEERIKRLPSVFQFIITYAQRYGAVFATSKDIEGIAVWLPSKVDPPNFWRLIRSGAFGVVGKMGSDLGRRLSKMTKQIDQQRLSMMKDDYLYLEGIGVKSSKRGTGYCSKLMLPMMIYCDAQQIPIYLETQNLPNVQMYQHFGFEIKKKEVVEAIGCDMWVMVREPKK